MKIIIIGDGKVGYSLAENLSKEDNAVTIIDKNSEALKKANENLDVMCIKGSGSSAKVLIEAGVEEADLLIAATTSDEMNMVCCLTAKKLGAVHTIARIRDPEYANELSLLKKELGLDLVINPEQAAAGEIAHLLRFPSATNFERFAKGRVNLVEIKVTCNMPLVGLKLKDIPGKISVPVLIGIVVRDGVVIIPKGGDFEIRENDLIYAIGRPANLFNFCRIMGKLQHKIKNVMIVGGGRIAYYLTNLITDIGMKVKIIENDRARCQELSELLPNALVIFGDGTDEDFLKSENLSDMDAFVALTGRDEENLMAGLMAKHNGVHRVITKINRMNYTEVMKGLGLDSIVSPKLIITNHMVKYTRGLKNAQGSSVQTLYRILNGQVEVMEFIADETTDFLNTPLKKLSIGEGILIGAIVRKNEIIIPHGGDTIKAGDSVIIIAKDRLIENLNNIISAGGLQSELQNSFKKLGDRINM